MTLSRLVQELKHPASAGDVVGVSCRRHPRNEHGDDHHEQWESPDEIEATEGPEVRPRFQTIFTTSLSGPKKLRCMRDCDAVQPVRRIHTPAAHAHPGPHAVVAGSRDVSSVVIVVTANTDSNRTLSLCPTGHAMEASASWNVRRDSKVAPHVRQRYS